VAPLLTLDQLEILSTSPAGEVTRVDLNAEDLAQLIAYGQETSTSGLDVELRLAGLADLLQATYGADQTPGRDAVYFIAETLVDIRARLETHRDTDRYRVRVVPAGAK
jgi:NADPH-dependent ferric siderophore reductase